MKILPLTGAMAQQYHDFICRTGESLFYHSLQFKTFLEKLLDCKSRYLVCWEDDRISGVFPLLETGGKYGKVFNSLPFFGSNGGILARDRESSRALLEAYNRLCAEEAAAAVVIENPFVQQDYTGIHHDYTDRRLAQWTDISYREDLENALLNTFDSSTRRNIRKAIKSDVTIAIDNTRVEFLKETHFRSMHKINGKTKPQRFFELFPLHFKEGEDFNIYTAKKDGQFIAALLLFYFNKTVEYYIPAIREDYKTYQPLALVVFQAMKDAARKGFQRWNWGGTWLSQEGVYKFKKKWGTFDKEYTYYIKINNKRILESSAQELIEEYNYFYVIPFDQLKNRVP